jgi:hypothetical protein
MPEARVFHTATLLSDGKVLVAGVWDGVTPSLVSAALYDPSTGTWTATASMSEGRYWPTATLLPNGKVLAAGGEGYHDPNRVTLATAELYTPDTSAGDLNGDGVANCADIAIIKASFGKKTGQAGFDVRADVNKNGVVDVRDLSFVSRQLPAGTKCI